MARISRILLTAFLIAAMAIGVLVYLSVRDRGAAGSALPDPGAVGQVVRENSHRLNSVPDSQVTFVEFLDLECEGCRAVYPAIEQARAEYGDRVNFVIRYFPLQAHVNAERAARAVEAAAQQGHLEAMYRKMYDTQAQWGEQRTPADEVFRGFAAELGLDLAAFDTATPSCSIVFSDMRCSGAAIARLPSGCRSGPRNAAPTPATRRVGNTAWSKPGSSASCWYWMGTPSIWVIPSSLSCR